MQRHHTETVPSHEGQPLRPQHISFQESDSFGHSESKRSFLIKWKSTLVGFVVLLAVVISVCWISTSRRHYNIVPIHYAVEHTVDIGHGLSIWYRTWGNSQNGIPVLFVHGGPGNCIADYGLGNARFFDYRDFFVVEVDQRGTGKSQPSIRSPKHGCDNMKYYLNISIEDMSHDYEVVRRHLQIDQWLVFGGSWGSTLALDYVERYPSRALGLILRGIWLNTEPEFAMFLRKTYVNNTKRLAEFDIWQELAIQNALERNEPPLDPNDGERFFRINERMILECNKTAIWRHFVWENNMMEEDPAKLLDPYKITPERLPEATSVAFFENQLFLHGTFDTPMHLLENVHRLQPVSTWMCQGLQDEVCPVKYGAERLASALIEAQVSTRMQFLNAGHEDTDTVIEQCLKDSVKDFLSKIRRRDTTS